MHENFLMFPFSHSLAESKKSFRKLNIDNIDNNNNLSESSSGESPSDDELDHGALHRAYKTEDGKNLQNKKVDDLEFNLKDYENVDVPGELKDIMQYISRLVLSVFIFLVKFLWLNSNLRYTPQRIDIDYKLQVFMPEFIPAVGDIDAFLKIVSPPPLDESSAKLYKDSISRLGLEVLDEPIGEQSEEALLQIKLRSIFPKPLATPSAVVKSPKDIDKWIQEIQSLHANQVHDNLMQQHQQSQATQINIDSLMTEWPEDLERKLDAIGLPPASLNCPLSEYVKIVCTLFDIPIENPKNHYDYIRALSILFNLYIAVRQEKWLMTSFICVYRKIKAPKFI